MHHILHAVGACIKFIVIYFLYLKHTNEYISLCETGCCDVLHKQVMGPLLKFCENDFHVDYDSNDPLRPRIWMLQQLSCHEICDLIWSLFFLCKNNINVYNIWIMRSSNICGMVPRTWLSESCEETNDLQTTFIPILMIPQGHWLWPIAAHLDSIGQETTLACCKRPQSYLSYLTHLSMSDISFTSIYHPEKTYEAVCRHYWVNGILSLYGWYLRLFCNKNDIFKQIIRTQSPCKIAKMLQCQCQKTLQIWPVLMTIKQPSEGLWYFSPIFIQVKT